MTERRVAPGEADAAASAMGLTIYGCEPDEATSFRQMARGFGIRLAISEDALSEATVGLAAGSRCVSIGHKSYVENSALRMLSQIGVRYISTRSIGLDHIDVGYANSQGIAVQTVPYSPDSVADYTLMLMLMAVRSARATVSRVQAHDYRLNEVRGRELRDMTVGVIGTGRIGTAVMDRLWGFGCNVVANDCFPKVSVGDCIPKLSAQYVPLDALLELSDIVTLHIPLNATTHHLLNRHRFEQMRKGAIVVNTGRGSLIETEDLVLALESGRLGGAALDVLEGEEGVFYSDHRHQPVENEMLLRLQELSNVVITPHTAYYTDHSLRDTVEQTLLNCMRFNGVAT